MLQFKLLIICLLVVFSSIVIADEEPELDEDGNPIIKLEKAPLWSIKNDNIELSSEMLLGRAYVLHFWSTWCVDCKPLQSGLNTVANDYIKDGITTYAISFWENPRTKPSAEIKTRGLGFTVLESGDEVAQFFGVVNPPTTIFVNHKGEITFKYMLADPNSPKLRVAYEELVDELSEKAEDEDDS